MVPLLGFLLRGLRQGRKAWDGKNETVETAQKALLPRSQANSEANKGEYVAGSQPSSFESLYVKNYVC